MSDIELDYDYLEQKALKRVVAEVLEITAELKHAPGEHHFYIEFLTQAPGVSVPDYLIASYPERMTIVLQHQFDNLIVTEETFSVTLWFKGKQADLIVPFEAVTRFNDPSVGYMMQFDLPQSADAPKGLQPAPDPAAQSADETEDKQDKNEASDEKKDGADVVSLDAFRKK